jgi:hypothetical protein
MLALAASETGILRQRTQVALRRGLDALAGLISPSGVLMPYGRSRNILFGHAAAVVALRRGESLFAERLYGLLADRIEARVRRFQHTDGHVPCVLNHEEEQKSDWDVYVNNPDYNAYAAAMLLLAEYDPVNPVREACASSRPLLSVGSLCSRGESKNEGCGFGTEVREIGPLLVVRQRELFAAFCTTGQTVPRGTPFFCDHRYYGMQPLWIENAGEAQLEPARYEWLGGPRSRKGRELLVDPATNSWIPYVTVDQKRYCVRRFDQVEIRQRGGTVVIEAEGCPEAYLPVPRWERGLRRLLANGREQTVPMFRRARLHGMRLQRCLEFHPESGVLQSRTSIEGAVPRGCSLHPGVQEWRATDALVDW